MSNKRKRKESAPQHGCESCSNCIPIGEGDHICDFALECGEESALVISDYTPTDAYLWCGGKKYQEG